MPMPSNVIMQFKYTNYNGQHQILNGKKFHFVLSYDEFSDLTIKSLYEKCNNIIQIQPELESISGDTITFEIVDCWQYNFPIETNGKELPSNLEMPLNTYMKNNRSTSDQRLFQTTFQNSIQQNVLIFNSIDIMAMFYIRPKRLNINNNDDLSLCIICNTNRRNVLLIPCNHFILCSDCHQRSCEIAVNEIGSHRVRCPVCRGNIINVRTAIY